MNRSREKARNFKTRNIHVHTLSLKSNFQAPKAYRFGVRQFSEKASFSTIKDVDLQTFPPDKIRNFRDLLFHMILFCIGVNFSFYLRKKVCIINFISNALIPVREIFLKTIFLAMISSIKNLCQATKMYKFIKENRSNTLVLWLMLIMGSPPLLIEFQKLLVLLIPQVLIR